MDDNEILNFAKDFRKGFLNGRAPDNMCFILSNALSGMLNAAGVENTLVEYEIDASNAKKDLEVDVIGHWVIKINNKILDPTASQFKGMPQVFFGHRPIWYMDVINEN